MRHVDKLTRDNLFAKRVELSEVRHAMLVKLKAAQEAFSLAEKQHECSHTKITTKGETHTCGMCGYIWE